MKLAGSVIGSECAWSGLIKASRRSRYARYRSMTVSLVLTGMCPVGQLVDLAVRDRHVQGEMNMQICVFFFFFSSDFFRHSCATSA